MSMIGHSLTLFDAVLALALIGIAVGVLIARDLFQAIVLFITFGLLMAVAWCRLGAVDVALAEAAIGAGLTGTLLLKTLAALPAASTDAALSDSRGKPSALAIVLPAALPAALLGWHLAGMATATDAPRIGVAEALPRSGVTNRVTAVLLNLRAYDTMLEVAVLVVAALVVVSPAVSSPSVTSERPAGPVLNAFLRFVVPSISVVAAYLLWAGSHAPGGAFQAAAVLTAAGVLLLVTGAQPPPLVRRLGPTLIVIGLATFLMIGVGPMAGGERFLEYRDGRAYLLILLVEAALTLSLAWILLTLFAGFAADQPPRSPRQPVKERSG